MSAHFRLTPAKLAVVALAAAASTMALPAAAAHADGGRTFYVSPSGSDAASGDQAHPFHSLAKVSNGFLQAGDTVLLQRGATFGDQLGIWSSGTSASRINVGAYGTGAKPAITGPCVQLGGDNITIQDVLVTNCTQDGIWVYGANDVVQNTEITHNIQGVAVDTHAQGTKILRNFVHNNDRMAPNTPGATDDFGAIGIVVDGDNSEVAYNTINDNYAPSADFGVDGSAVEIYGGIGTFVHHNMASNNETFTELGNARSANTVFAYNQVTSSLNDSEFLITRGAQDGFGPVAGTVAVNNTVKLDGPNSRGFVCYAGCTPALFTMYNNVLDVAGQIGYLQGTMSGGNNIYWRGAMSIPTMPGDRYVDPMFHGGKLVPSPKSPAVDAGRNASIKVDLDGQKVGVDGNGDGTGGTDIGAYEVHPAKAGKSHHHSGHGHHAHGHHAHGHHAHHQGGKHKHHHHKPNHHHAHHQHTNRAKQS